MRHRLRPDDRLEIAERAQRHHAAGLIAHVETRQVRGGRTRGIVGLQRHTERSPEQVKVVDVERTQIDLQRVEHVGQTEAQKLRLVAVEVVVELRRRRAERGEELLRTQLRLLARFRDERLRDIVERDAAASAQVLELKLEAAGGAEAGNRRRVETQDDGFRQAKKLRPQLGDEIRRALLGRTLIPWLEDRELHRRIRLRGVGEEVQAADRTDNIHSRRALENITYFPGHRVGTFERRAVRQLDDDEEIALILHR